MCVGRGVQYAFIIYINPRVPRTRPPPGRAEFSRSYVLGKKLGEGAFAEVFKASLRGALPGSQPYAVKRTVRRGLAKEDEKALFEEVRKLDLVDEYKSGEIEQ